MRFLGDVAGSAGSAKTSEQQSSGGIIFILIYDNYAIQSHLNNKIICAVSEILSTVYTFTRGFNL